MVNLETYNSFANIREVNKSFKWSVDDGKTWTVLHVPTGCYDLKAMNADIIRIRGNSDILILPNVNTLQCILTVVGEKYSMRVNILLICKLKPGQNILEAPHTIIYLPVTVDVISTVSVWLTDEHGEPLDLRGEELTIRSVNASSMYIQYKVNVFENQVDTLEDSIRLKKDVTHSFLKGGFRGDHVLLLTPAQILHKSYQLKYHAKLL